MSVMHFSHFLFPLDESTHEKKKKKKKKKRSAAIVSIEEDNSQDIAGDVKGFPLDDSTVKDRDTSTSNSDSKTSTMGHSRSSSYPGNITIVAEGSTEKKSRVNGQEILFTEITKSISLPDNSVVVENITESTPEDSKNSSFDLGDFLENVAAEPRYDTVGEGVQETTTGDESDNFVFHAADLFLRHPRVNSEERTSPQLQNVTKSDHNKEISLGTPTVSETTNKPMRNIQGDITANEKDFLENQIVSESESFDPSFSNTKMYYSQEREDLSRREPNVDSFHVYSLTENGTTNRSNFPVAQKQAPTVVEKMTEVVNESQGSSPVNLDNRHISKGDVEGGSSSAQEPHDFRQSTSGEAFRQRTENREEFDEEEFRNDLSDNEAATTNPESQSGANNGTIEPVVLLDSGEPLVPLEEGGKTAKSGAQSTLYCEPEVSAENDRDSLSRSVRN